LLRAAESLKVLAKRATSSPNGCLAAVTHSAFLKILLGMVLDEPLADAASRKVDNGGITVIDVPRNFQTRALGSNPRLLGGILSQAPSNFDLKIPICNVVKINESRHLPLIPQGELLERRSAKS
jgi:broad specificity phosphatase PhoE